MIKKSSSETTFFCNKCNYKTLNKYDWTKHLKTKKHLKLITKPLEVSNEYLAIKSSNDYICNECGKVYKFSSGLSRHMKTCFNSSNESMNDKIKLEPEKVNIVNNQNEQIKNLHELLQKTIENQNNLIGKVGNTTNNINNTMTINLILNEKCKNAMNLTDFMDSLKLSLEDLKYTCDNGYIKGITNILVKNLADINPNKRPFHCNDNNTSLEFFVKDENSWEQDNKHKKINKSIEQITQKQIQHIKEWEQYNPRWNESENGTELYMSMIKEVMGGMTDKDKIVNIENIKKEIGTKVELNTVIPIEDLNDKN